MLKRIPDESPGKGLLYRILFLYRKIFIFCSPYSTRHCFGSPSAKSVPICFRCFVPVVREVEGSRGSSAGSLAAGEGCPGEWVILHTKQCWPRVVGQSRKGNIGIFQLENVFPFSVKYIILKSEYVYFTGKRIIFPTHSPALSFLLVSLGPKQKSNPMKKVTLLWNLPLSLYPNINPEEQSKRRERVPLKWLNSHAAPEHEQSRKEECDAQSQHKSII